ncbi:hypothetical protein H6G80_18715 [Nostoc sp. FACHB-87]|uniref:hypothetical protein n=1 Tax=Nostocales TaxID=1161 RepID=UPI001688293E|nr:MULTISPECIES: hypothetical protein [Nostocales]MBD2301270.1 hypothetical protein [Nostoc sp. FACHB-190]MBD2456101.1 hypothetical protein [Nostoc sp. FACHB-87]MBD2473852.1 hypothetical protein [Anabaena sp. FACHB-83]MBD2490526.1 hypothetical protein [Aulosira sp. FACHB-615]
MHKSPNYYRILCYFVLVAGLSGCAAWRLPEIKGSNFIFGSNVTQIAEIQAKPNTQATVYIQGKVEKQVPLMKQWAYQIDDSTGKIWVITNQSNLQKGTQVVLKGKVSYKSIPIAGQDFGEVYITEE